jgi:diamine N-acetyltransferase
MKIILRALETSDIDILYDWENDREIWRVSHTIAPFSRYILEKYIESSHLDIYESKQLRLMIDLVEGEKKITVGAIDLFEFDPFNSRAGVGILIKDNIHRNKGIASTALKEFIDYAFSTLMLNQLFCNIAPDNERSIHLFTKAGFKLIGTKQQWNQSADGFVDEMMYQLLSSDYLKS